MRPRGQAKRGKYFKWWIEKKMNSSAWKTARDVYCHLVLIDGYPLSREQLVKLGNIYEPSAPDPVAQFLRLFNTRDRGQRPFFDDVIKRMAEIASEKVGENLLQKQAELLKRAMELAEDSEDVDEILKVVKEIDKYTGASLKKKVEIEAKGKRAYLPENKENKEVKLLEEIASSIDDGDE